MNPRSEPVSIAGPAGAIACAVDAPAGAPIGLAVVCHPHPQHGGTMDNKVVHTLARALVQLGWRVVRFNFRGVGESAGAWDGGRGEIDDALAVIAAQRRDGERLALAGFSFGGYVATHAAARAGAERLALVGPAVVNFAPAPVSDDTLVVHGEEDDVVPLAAVLDWARPSKLPVVVVPGVGHFFHGALPVLKSIVLRAWR